MLAARGRSKGGEKGTGGGKHEVEWRETKKGGDDVARARTEMEPVGGSGVAEPRQGGSGTKIERGLQGEGGLTKLN